MTLALSELLLGSAAGLSVPPPPEAAGDYMAGMVGAVALIAVLAAQEAEIGAAVRVRENAAMRALFRDAANSGIAGDLTDALITLAAEQDHDLAISALDAANDRLRAALIDFHELVERPALAAWEGRILRLLRTFANDRLLTLPAVP